MVSFSGVKRAGSTMGFSSPITVVSWVRKSPKKPPVTAPITKVLTPHRPSRAKKFHMPPRGRTFFSTNTEPSIISSPYPMSASIIP